MGLNLELSAQVENVIKSFVGQRKSVHWYEKIDNKVTEIKHVCK